jgi:hypothetical protein
LPENQVKMALRYILLGLLACWQCACSAQSAPETKGRPGAEKYASEQYAKHYERYREPALTNRRFKLADIEPIIQRLPAPFRVEQAGRSIENRNIYRVTLGNGPVKVLLWSQMHGDEPTATAALFDLFRFFQTRDEYDALRARLLDRLTLVFIPMLNPDGAERFERRNALGIDLNRDALRLASPEARLLKAERDRLSADWGFNLHDQGSYYAAGYPAKHPASLSFLAPAYNFEKEINTNRREAMQLIGLLHNALQPMAADRIARYDDDFEPRAFGDNMQRWGTRTILIESGGYPDDPERQQVRRLNFVTLLTALEAIAGEQYNKVSADVYESIPFNGSGVFHDLIVREVSVTLQGQRYTIDLGWRSSEADYRGAREFYYRGSISDVGDLSYFNGYEELPPSGLSAGVGEAYTSILPDVAALRQIDPIELLRQGIAVVRLQRLPPPQARDRLPLLLLGPDTGYDKTWRQGSNPPLLLRDAGGQVRYAVINGHLVDLSRPDLSQWNALGR